ncbi:unnamed protein product [Cylindrotheca closterium]|uniref:DDE Tnp4 domain-containing protein n=2 Tax=Cylindrotheca closterium TaxID=2856 RepID=A0AAD2G0P5_9STRA|nr:unnamed protein product [Cylindrotheca closterium]CAJ1968094.1 unnamed protein product [Cylindrotheca closterium]
MNRSLPIYLLRPTFDQFTATISASHFRKMFRMTQSMFATLCATICNEIGPEVFRSESFLSQRRERIYGSQEPREQAVAPVSGEIRVAIGLRMLAGGSYLDLVPLFRVSSSQLYDVFDTFLVWILATFKFPLPQYFAENNWPAIERLAFPFAEKTNGIFYGVFAALDGLAVRIKGPRIDEVPDPGNYYCRKGFFALNVQAMCDKAKYFLWCFPANKGSTHDSTAFANSTLFDILRSKAEELRKRDLFVAGDSAYGLTSFLMTPYDKEEMKHDDLDMKDAFNFYLSSCRIYIECAFGELVMRWGILWRTLHFRLKKCMEIIRVCMLLHNFILDHQEESERYNMSEVQNFDIEMDQLQQNITQATGEIPLPTVSDNNEPKPSGRRTKEEVNEKALGENIRFNLAYKLASAGLSRPMVTGMHTNKHGHVYMTE